MLGSSVAKTNDGLGCEVSENLLGMDWLED